MALRSVVAGALDGVLRLQQLLTSGLQLKQPQQPQQGEATRSPPPGLAAQLRELRLRLCQVQRGLAASSALEHVRGCSAWEACSSDAVAASSSQAPPQGGQNVGRQPCAETPQRRPAQPSGSMPALHAARGGSCSSDDIAWAERLAQRTATRPIATAPGLPIGAVPQEEPEAAGRSQQAGFPSVLEADRRASYSLQHVRRMSAATTASATISHGMAAPEGGGSGSSDAAAAANMAAGACMLGAWHTGTRAKPLLVCQPAKAPLGTAGHGSRILAAVMGRDQQQERARAAATLGACAYARPATCSSGMVTDGRAAAEHRSCSSSSSSSSGDGGGGGADAEQTAVSSGEAGIPPLCHRSAGPRSPGPALPAGSGGASRSGGGATGMRQHALGRLRGLWASSPRPAWGAARHTQ